LDVTKRAFVYYTQISNNVEYQRTNQIRIQQVRH